MDSFRYVSDEKMKPTESIEVIWPMRELGQDRQSTLDFPVRIKVVDLWVWIRKCLYVKELCLTHRRSSVLASSEYGRHLEACAGRNGHNWTLWFDTPDSNNLSITLSRIPNDSREVGDISGHRASTHVDRDFELWECLERRRGIWDNGVHTHLPRSLPNIGMLNKDLKNWSILGEVW